MPKNIEHCGDIDIVTEFELDEITLCSRPACTATWVEYATPEATGNGTAEAAGANAASGILPGLLFLKGFCCRDALCFDLRYRGRFAVAHPSRKDGRHTRLFCNSKGLT